MKRIDYINKIKAVMKIQHSTQEELAEEIGVTFSTLNRWINGHTTPQPAHLRQIDRLYKNYVGIEPLSNKELQGILNKVESQGRKFGDIKKHLKNDQILDAFLVELTHSSDAIEGSTLNKRETEAIIFDKAIVKDKDLTEHLRAMNLSIILRQVLTEPVGPIEEGWVLDCHKRLMQGLRTDGGKYARHRRGVRGVELILPHPSDIAEEMKEFYAKINDFKGHDIEHVANMHVDFVSIHPFGDGNGRIGRAIMIAQLIDRGFAPCIIGKDSKAEYYECIDFAQKKSPSHMTKFVAESVLKGYQLIQRYV